jgi:hypothetical protein
MTKRKEINEKRIFITDYHAKDILTRNITQKETHFSTEPLKSLNPGRQSASSTISHMPEHHLPDYEGEVIVVWVYR